MVYHSLDSQSDQSDTLEFKLDQIGITSYHYKLLLVLGLAQVADASEIMGISFVLPDSSGMAQDLNVKKESFSGHVSAALFLGMIVGAYLFGTLSDKFGRRRALICSMGVNFLSGFLSALVPNWYLLLVTRFLSGVGAGGALPISFTYFIEFLGSKHRERWVIQLSNCWCFGVLFVSFMGYLTLPSERHFGNFARWRLFFILISLPSLLTMLCVLFVLDDSPKFLREKKMFKELSLLLFKISGKSSHDEYQQLNESNTSMNVEHSPPMEQTEERKYSLKEHVKNLKSMFSKEYMRSSVGLGLLWFSYCFAYYGWLLFEPTFVESSIGEGIYFESLLGAGAQLCGTLATILLISKLEAGSCVAISCSLSAATMFIFQIEKSYGTLGKSMYYVLWAVFSFVSSVCPQALNVMQGEAFHTKLRGTAFGFNTMLGRIGAVIGTEIFGLFPQTSYMPVFICAVFFLVATVAAKIVEGKKGKAIH